MHSTQGSTNGTTIAVSVLVIVLIAVGVWWYLNTTTPHGAAQGDTTRTPATGQLQGMVQ